MTLAMRFSSVRYFTTLVDKTARFHPTPITVAQLTEFGKTGDISKSYEYLHKELPIRISHMVKELQMLPDALLQQHSVKQVKDMYLKTFEELSEFYPEGGSDEKNLNRFTRKLAEIKRRHQNVVETMAEGILSLKRDTGDRFDPSINYFLDRFYTSRIAIRVIMSNHLVLFGPEEQAPGHYGIIDPSLDVHDIVDDAASGARYLCTHHYGSCPDIEISTISKYILTDQFWEGGCTVLPESYIGDLAVFFQTFQHYFKQINLKITSKDEFDRALKTLTFNNSCSGEGVLDRLRVGGDAPKFNKDQAWELLRAAYSLIPDNPRVREDSGVSSVLDTSQGASVADVLRESFESLKKELFAVVEQKVEDKVSELQGRKGDVLEDKGPVAPVRRYVDIRLDNCDDEGTTPVCPKTQWTEVVKPQVEKALKGVPVLNAVVNKGSVRLSFQNEDQLKEANDVLPPALIILNKTPLTHAK
eukprot:sb/3464370/